MTLSPRQLDCLQKFADGKQHNIGHCHATAIKGLYNRGLLDASDEPARWYIWGSRSIFRINEAGLAALETAAVDIAAEEAELAQRWVGWCPVCERDIRLDPSMRLVHHGYERPGYGYIVGDCLGVGFPPYELSDESLRYYRNVVKADLSAAKKALQHAKSGEAVFTVNRYIVAERGYRDVEVYPGDPDYRSAQQNAVRHHAYNVQSYEEELKRVNTLIKKWKKRPVRTFLEGRAAKRQEQAQKAAVRAAKREAKLNKTIQWYQKQIDSALRRRDLYRLDTLFEGMLDIGYKHKISKREAINRVDRTDLWLQLGWLDEEGNIMPEKERWAMRHALEREGGWKS